MKEVEKQVTVNISNLGPITEAKIILNPLTIFFGVNNSGKSYAATAIYSILSTINSIKYISSLEDMGTFQTDIRPIMRRVEQSRSVKSFYAWIKELQKPGEYKVPKSITSKIKTSSKNVLRSILDFEFQRVFEDDLKSLIRNQPKSRRTTKSEDDKITLELTLKCGTCTIRYKLDEQMRRSKLGYELGNVEMSAHVLKRKKVFLVSFSFVINNVHTPGPILDIPSNLSQAGLLYRVLVESLLGNSVETPFDQIAYLPAARSGILQGYKAISLGGLGRRQKHLRTQLLSGVILDFFKTLTWLDDKKLDLSGITDDFERDVFKGGSILIQSGEELLPEFFFATKGMLIPLQNASSSVSELTPLLAYLDFVVTSKSLLIIEEPEAHLDPVNQTKVAYFIARLVNAGLHVIVTTHSDFFISALNNCIRWGYVKEKKRKERGRELILKPNCIAAFLFKIDTDVEPLRISMDEGITEEQFAKIRRHLYDESIELDIALSDDS